MATILNHDTLEATARLVQYLGDPQMSGSKLVRCWPHLAGRSASDSDIKTLVEAINAVTTTYISPKANGVAYTGSYVNSQVKAIDEDDRGTENRACSIVQILTKVDSIGTVSDLYTANYRTTRTNEWLRSNELNRGEKDEWAFLYENMDANSRDVCMKTITDLQLLTWLVYTEDCTDTWVGSTSYSLGAVVYVKNKPYICISAHTSSDFTTDLGASRWRVGQDVTTGWVTSTSYVVGDMVTNSGNDYLCISAHTSGVFATDLAAGRWAGMVQASGTWQTNKAYVAGNIVTVNYVPYICLTNHTADVFATDLSSAKWATYPRTWVTGTAYTAGTLVINAGLAYKCITAHTSASAFVTDLTAGKWDIHWNYVKRTWKETEDSTGTFIVELSHVAWDNNASDFDTVAKSNAGGYGEDRVDRASHVPTALAENMVNQATGSATAWAGTTAYVVSQLVTKDGYTYICVTAHTSNADFLVDYNAGKWLRIAGASWSDAGEGSRNVSREVHSGTVKALTEVSRTTATGNQTASVTKVWYGVDPANRSATITTAKAYTGEAGDTSFVHKGHSVSDSPDGSCTISATAWNPSTQNTTFWPDAAHTYVTVQIHTKEIANSFDYKWLRSRHFHNVTYHTTKSNAEQEQSCSNANGQNHGMPGSTIRQVSKFLWESDDVQAIQYEFEVAAPNGWKASPINTTVAWTPVLTDSYWFDIP